jgi:sugar lactone lactonase YvrE
MMTPNNSAAASMPSLDAISFIGSGLLRPESVLCTRKGDIFTSHRQGGVSWIRPDGAVSKIGNGAITPNGIALLPDRSFLLANHKDDGGVYRLTHTGELTPWLMEVEGVPLPSVNFVYCDLQGRIWICLSTVRKGDDQYRHNVRDGFVVLVDDRGARVVAQDLCWTNECRVNAAGDKFYVNETFGRRLTRFDIAPDGALSRRESFAEFGAGTFPDGLALDAAGNIWVVSVGSNRVIQIEPNGRQNLILEDCDPAHLDRLDAALQQHTLTRPMLMDNHSLKLKNISSIAFGGPDLRTVVLGCLGGDALATFRSPVAGLPPAHWEYSF